MRGIVTSLLPLPLLVPLASLSAQAPLSLEPGARVRITAPDCGVEKQTATLEALQGGMLVLDGADCPLASVAKLDPWSSPSGFAQVLMHIHHCH